MKNKYSILKSKAILLRNRGYSYGEISKKLSIPKSTLSYWLKSIPLSKKFKDRLYTKQINNLSQGSQSQKNRREIEVKAVLELAEQEIKAPLPEEVFKLMGAALYWGEGSKGKRAQITNSDPRLIFFMVKWINKFFKVPPEKLTARLNIYSEQSEKEIIKYWSKLLNIPINNFGKSYIKPAGSGYRKNNLYYGTIRIEIPKSTDICYQINGWINGALKGYSLKSYDFDKQWKHNIKLNKSINLK